jgi:hypothetical protein
MTVVTVAGHGGWDRATLRERGEENWVRSAPVPVYFFTENMKSMWGMGAKSTDPADYQDADRLATMDEADLMQLVADAKYSRKVDAGSGCLNYVVGDDETSEDLVAGDGVTLHHGGEYSLLNLFDAYPDATAIFWCCCSAGMLNEVGGEQLGVDEAQNVGVDANQGAQSDWAGYSGDFTPQGVQQCDATCPECNASCRLGTEHLGNYDHQCEQGHTFSDDEAALNMERLFGNGAPAAEATWRDDPDWQAFVERLLTSDEDTGRQMWGELGYDTQAMLREDDRVSTWAQGAGV